LNILPDVTGAQAARTANLGLGGNMGDPKSAMAEALRRIDGRSDCRVSAVSRLYRTPPWGNVDQDWFFNACAQVETTLEPLALLDVCLGIEKDMKRERLVRWGPRTIDMDVLTFADLEQKGERLILPHPRMLERGFVLLPLADYAPNLKIKGHSIAEWLARADVAGIEISDADPNWWRA
jgi:2-amino-4-hydroxy-6-hydroxymethyldihydropteridine diphosphokinase